MRRRKKRRKMRKKSYGGVVVFGKNSNNSKYSPLNTFADCKLPKNVLECCKDFSVVMEKSFVSLLQQVESIMTHFGAKVGLI